MNILFTCAGRRTYLLKYFKENLSEGDKVVATDMQLSAPALQVADVKLQVPAVYDPKYIDITLQICKEQKIDALLSLNDLELPLLAENKARFEAEGVKVIVSDPKVIDIAFDKYKTAQWVESLGLKSPKTFVRLDDAKRALQTGELVFPLFMKPRWGSGSIGLETIADMEELDTYYNLLMKKIKKTILATASMGDEYIMIQEKLTGNEFGLDVMNDLEGNHVAVSVKQKFQIEIIPEYTFIPTDSLFGSIHPSVTYHPGYFSCQTSRTYNKSFMIFFQLHPVGSRTHVESIGPSFRN